MIGRVLILMAAAGGAACALLGRGGFEDPEIAVSQVALRGVGLSGGILVAVLNITNPNAFDINGTRLDMDLEVEGEHVADLVLDQAFTVPGHQCTTVNVPVRFGWKGAAWVAKAALNDGTLDYQVNGNATVNTPLGLADVPFDREGNAPVSELAGKAGVGIPKPTEPGDTTLCRPR